MESLFAGYSVPSESNITLEVTVENLEPENGAFVTPVWFGFHDGSFETFEVGESASSGIMYVAEEGITGLENTVPGVVETLLEMGLDPADVPPTESTIAGIFADSEAGENGGTQGLVDSPENVAGLAPGDSLSVTVDIDSDNLANNRFFNYAAMFFPSNDGFVANSEGIEIFDEDGNFIGQDIIITGNDVFDAGTEVNDENPANVPLTLDLIGNGIEENGVIQPHPGLQPPGSGGVLDFANGLFANSDFTDLDAPIARISINPVINGTADNDLLLGENSLERINGFEGNDLIFSQDGDDTLDGGAGEDRLFGNDGNDYLLGSDGDDYLVGGDGDDLIDGGAGDDYLVGNFDADRFVLRMGDGQDTIFDYEDSVDSLALADGLEFEQLTIIQGVGEAIISVTETNEELAILTNANINDITIEDFISLV